MAMKTGREMAGLAVVSLGGGDRLGRIDDIVFRLDTGRVTGFLVDRGGMFSKPKFLPAAQVQSVGADALTVPSEGVFSDAPTDPAEIAAKSLESRPVLAPAGTVIGKVADVLVETDGLLVPALLIATGLLPDALHGKPRLPLASVQTIGADSVITTQNYDPKAPDARA
jgi:uncharacterized protein YrrD